MPRLTVTLDPPTADALRRIAHADQREPRQEAAFLLIRALAEEDGRRVAEPPATERRQR